MLVEYCVKSLKMPYFIDKDRGNKVENIELFLNKMAEDDWELFNIDFPDGNYTLAMCIFKREAVNDTPNLPK